VYAGRRVAFRLLVRAAASAAVDGGHVCRDADRAAGRALARRVARAGSDRDAATSGGRRAAALRGSEAPAAGGTDGCRDCAADGEDAYVLGARAGLTPRPAALQQGQAMRPALQRRGAVDYAAWALGRDFVLMQDQLSVHDHLVDSDRVL